MEKLKPIHDHKLTDLIKVCIFALMLLLPFLIWIPTGIYYGFNEHANQVQSIPTEMVNAWKTMWTTDVFSWTQNSILYTGLTNFTGVLGINQASCINNLLTYELIITTIYIVLDIVLTLFKWLTHIGQKE